MQKPLSAVWNFLLNLAFFSGSYVYIQSFYFNALNRTYIYIYIIYIVTSWLPPPYYHHHPVPYSPPFTRLPTGVGVREEGRWNARSGGVWWGTPEVNGASSPPLLYASAPLLWRPVSSPCMHAGVLVGPGRERLRDEHAPVRRLMGQDAGPYNPWKRRGPKGGRSRWMKPPTLAPRTREGSACGCRTPPPYLDPSFSNTALPARRGHQIPCLFWTL